MAIQPAGSRSFRPFPNNHSAVAIWLMLALLSARAEADDPLEFALLCEITDVTAGGEDAYRAELKLKV